MRVSICALLGGAALAAAQAASSNAFVPVVGLTGDVNESTGERPPRININTLHSNGGPGWDLYIQALAQLQALPESDEKSWFQLMGIHGLPFESWNGIGQVSGGGNMYCPHGQVLFGSWHRPFLALYEQELMHVASEIAAKYTGADKAKYASAVSRLRIPFWDWASNSQLPSAVTATEMTINSPTGSKTIRNPLYSYKFQKWPFTYPNFGGTIAQYSQTMRCPSTSDSSAVPQNNVANSNLANDATGLKNAVYLTFSKTTSYSQMVTTSTPGNNFESPHNTIHDDTGCGGPVGHMTNLGWSAFDPLFMLHHANVDRLIAMWQAIHYNNQMFTSTFTTNAAMYGTPKGVSYDEISPLKPFVANSQGLNIDSRYVTSTKIFGYTYPEIKDWTMSQSALATYVTGRVNALYGSSSNGAIQGANNKVDAPAPAAAPAHVTQYMATISVDRSEVALPATISVYENGTKAGSMSLLSMPMTGTAYDNILLPESTAQGLDHHGSPSPSYVAALKKGLKVQVTSLDGTQQSLSDIPSLKVQIEAHDVVPSASSTQFPKYLNSTEFGLIIKDIEKDIENLFE